MNEVGTTDSFQQEEAGEIHHESFKNDHIDLT